MHSRRHFISLNQTHNMMLQDYIGINESFQVSISLTIQLFGLRCAVFKQFAWHHGICVSRFFQLSIPFRLGPPVESLKVEQRWFNAVHVNGGHKTKQYKNLLTLHSCTAHHFFEHHFQYHSLKNALRMHECKTYPPFVFWPSAGLRFAPLQIWVAMAMAAQEFDKRNLYELEPTSRTSTPIPILLQLLLQLESSKWINTKWSLSWWLAPFIFLWNSLEELETRRWTTMKHVTLSWSLSWIWQHVRWIHLVSMSLWVLSFDLKSAHIKCS